MDLDKKILSASTRMRLREQAMHADGSNTEKQRQHWFAVRDWRALEDKKASLAFKQKSSVSVLADPSRTSTNGGSQ